MNDIEKTNVEELSIREKLITLTWISIKQQERWNRIKSWHNKANAKMEVRHFFMKEQIDVMRSQKKKAEKIKLSLYSKN